MSIILDRNKVGFLHPCSSSAYEHRFGGKPIYNGIIPEGESCPLHLLLELDTDDPNCCFRTNDIRQIPLLYPFRYDRASLGYQVMPNSEIKILYLDHGGVPDDFPYEDYPAVFNESRLSLRALDTNEYVDLLIQEMEIHDFEDEQDRNEHISRYFTEDEQKELHARLDGSSGDKKAGQDSNNGLSPSDLYNPLRLGGAFVPMQLETWTRCKNPSCDTYDKSDQIEIFTIIPNFPVDCVSLWGEYGEFVEIIYEICHSCGTIYADNQCD